jgi:hypothetical protein
VIVEAWQVLVLVGSGAAYHGLVKKGEGAAFTLLATVGVFAVLALGSLSLETQYTTSGEWGITILFLLTASIAAVAFPVALTKSGPYATEDDDEDARPDEVGEADSDFLTGLARRMS